MHGRRSTTHGKNDCTGRDGIWKRMRGKTPGIRPPMGWFTHASCHTSLRCSTSRLLVRNVLNRLTGSNYTWYPPTQQPQEPQEKTQYNYPPPLRRRAPYAGRMKSCKRRSEEIELPVENGKLESKGNWGITDQRPHLRSRGLADGKRIRRRCRRRSAQHRRGEGEGGKARPSLGKREPPRASRSPRGENHSNRITRTTRPDGAGVASANSTRGREV